MIRGVATGVYRYIYPQKISNRFVHVWDIDTCFEIALTSSNVYPPPNQIFGYVTDDDDDDDDDDDVVDYVEQCLLLVDGLIGVLKRSGEASRFVTLMELTGMTHQLQRMHEFTVFLPSNDAIQVPCLFQRKALHF